MQTFNSIEAAVILDRLIIAIQKNKQYLSDIDGLIGDGDHGINMNKGFTICRQELDNNPGDFVHGLKVLSKILRMKIGGSMGPLYGGFFRALATSLDGKEEIGSEDISRALTAMVEAIASISPAKPGDKTMVDALVPAVAAYTKAYNEGQSFPQALDALKTGARSGRDSTKNMVARLGRASSLGERSRGVLDAGATSCCLILESLADSIMELLKDVKVEQTSKV